MADAQEAKRLRATIRALVADKTVLQEAVSAMTQRNQQLEANLSTAEAGRDAACAEVERLRARADGGWQYGFADPTTGEWTTRDDEDHTRALARLFGRPIQRRRVWLGPVETVPRQDQSIESSEVNKAMEGS